MKSRLVAVGDLSADVRERMFELLSRFFLGVSERRFALDLAEKDWAVVLENGDGRLVGFSTLRLDRVEVDSPTTPPPVLTPLAPLSMPGEGGTRTPDSPSSRPEEGGWGDEDRLVDVVTSGDTIVAPEAWGASWLSPAWIAAVRSLDRGARLLWLLLVSGWRTYRFLPVFWREFHPRWDVATPPEMRRTIDRLAGERFGAAYDAGAGVVRFAEPQILVPELGGIPESRRGDPHVDYFASINPGHQRGDELVCLTELAESNLTPAGWRMVRRGESLAWASRGATAASRGGRR